MSLSISCTNLGYERPRYLYQEHLVEYGPPHTYETFLMKAKDLVICTPVQFNIDTQNNHTWSRRYIFQSIIFDIHVNFGDAKIPVFFGQTSTNFCWEAPVPRAKVTRTKTSKMILHLLGEGIKTSTRHVILHPQETNSWNLKIPQKEKEKHRPKLQTMALICGFKLSVFGCVYVWWMFP